MPTDSSETASIIGALQDGHGTVSESSSMAHLQTGASRNQALLVVSAPRGRVLIVGCIFIDCGHRTCAPARNHYGANQTRHELGRHERQRQQLPRTSAMFLNVLWFPWASGRFRRVSQHPSPCAGTPEGVC